MDYHHDGDLPGHAWANRPGLDLAFDDLRRAVATTILGDTAAAVRSRRHNPRRRVTGRVSQWTTSGSRLDWATGDEPMTGAQASYLETLSREAGEEARRPT